MTQDLIRIGGAGLSGLAAAITLSKAGKKVEVYESNTSPGGTVKYSLQGLDNFTTKYDIIKKLKGFNLDLKIDQPIKRVVWYSPSLHKLEVIDKIPIFYLVRRGGESSIEVKLAEKAEKLGVKFFYGKRVNDNNVDIVATGSRKTYALAFGGVYSNVNMDSKTAYAFLDDNIAPKGYFYILPHTDGKATIATALSDKKRFQDIRSIFKSALVKHKKISEMVKDAKLEYTISGYTWIRIPKTAKINKRFYVGEAAGFQDARWGFGMKYALFSGYFAARSIIDGGDYDSLWKKEFLNEMERNLTYRFVFNFLGNKGYDKLIQRTGPKMNRKSYRELFYKDSKMLNVLKPIIYISSKLKGFR